MTPDFIIPVALAIHEFRDHLRCHPRTILSARYGDGKSFFLNAFMNDEEVKKEFQFIKLYPVNYQVLENRDIFEVIKYDILMQMGLQEMIDLSYSVSSRDAFFFCMKNHGLDISESLFDIASNIEGLSLVKAIGKIGKSSIGFVKEIKEAAKEYQEYKAGDLAVLDKYLDTADDISIFEEDLITRIIRVSLDNWRLKEENKNKKVVLLLEDMDRIDPAHLFRVMNVFSAHMDFIYKYGAKSDDSLSGNKFGFDNVVMVIHYENLKSLFAHFYGPDTCFEGYIHKFADKGKFIYSLKTESIKYYYDSLCKLSQIPVEILRQIIPEDRIRFYTLREMSNSLDRIDEQRINIEGVKYDIAMVMVCLRRFGFADSEIINCFRKGFDNDINQWMCYLYPYLKHFRKLQGYGLHIFDNKGNVKKIMFQESGDCVSVYPSNYPSSSDVLKIDDIHREILMLVIK